jgi:asparagine synthase (glutamine-hydrolysing)
VSGICGIVNFDGAPVDPELLKKMAEAAAYRGPDGIHYWIQDNVGLAHLALHTTPESLREHQPLVNRRGDLVLTADARVDNRDELIPFLTAKGHLQEESPTDADLVLAAYECWGERCPEHIIGDFALAIWDSRKQHLFCARDVFGTKPLHYSQGDNILCIASEAQQILVHPQIPHGLDDVAVALHLAANFLDEERTIFRDIRRLRPAHYILVDHRVAQLRRYWDAHPRPRIFYSNDEDYAHHFRDIFQRAVSARVRTQAPVVGVLMSGGLDSCSVAAMALHTLPRSLNQARLISYSNAFYSLESCDERDYSRAMADEMRLEIEYVDAERFWLLGDRSDFTPRLETPFMVWEESTGRSALQRLQKQGARVILSGLGGDDMVRGSQWVFIDRLLHGDVGALRDLYQLAQERNTPFLRVLYSRLLRPLAPDRLVGIGRRLLKRVPQSQGPGVPLWITPGLVNRTDLERRLTPPRIGSGSFLSPARREIHLHATVMGTVGLGAYWLDSVAAGFGLEGRHPFLDRRLAEFVLSLPPQQLFLGVGARKLILRQAMAGILPELIRQRHDKTAFTDFIDLSLKEKAADQITTLLKEPLLGRLGYVDADRLRDGYQRFRQGERDPARQLWFAITLELWLRQHYDVFAGDEPLGD